MPLVILVDANSVGYAGQHAADLKTGDQPTQAIYNTLQNLRTLKSKHRGAKIFYLWDNKADFRYALHPDYKVGRAKTDEQKQAKEEYHSQTPFIARMLTALGIPQVSKEGFEADDLAFHLSRHFSAKGYDVKLVSSDRDWLQLIDERVSWYCPRLDKICNAALFEEITGYKTVEKFISAKCIEGDKSDGIDGIPGLGKKACETMFDKWPTVAAMVKEHRALGGFTKDNIGSQFGRYINKINAFCTDKDLLRQYARNQKLMNLALAPEVGSLSIAAVRPDADDFWALCEELAFVSVLRKKGIFDNLFFPEREVA